MLDRWLTLYRAVARRNVGEPDAGRRLVAWAHEAGCDDVEPTASAWCFATPDDRDWWATTWAERVTASSLGEQLMGSGLSDPTELRSIANAWRAWADDPDGWFAVPHGEVICRVEDA